MTHRQFGDYCGVCAQRWPCEFFLLDVDPADFAREAERNREIVRDMRLRIMERAGLKELIVRDTPG